MTDPALDMNFAAIWAYGLLPWEPLSGAFLASPTDGVSDIAVSASGDFGSDLTDSSAGLYGEDSGDFDPDWTGSSAGLDDEDSGDFDVGSASFAFDASGLSEDEFGAGSSLLGESARVGGLSSVDFGVEGVASLAEGELRLAVGDSGKGMVHTPSLHTTPAGCFEAGASWTTASSRDLSGSAVFSAGVASAGLGLAACGGCERVATISRTTG